MSILSPRLQLKVSQKQILTPGLVQMVTVLQLNRLELKEMINQEIVDNPARVVGYGFGAGYKDMICTIILSKSGVKLGIVGSAAFPDPNGLLEGTGKRHRYVSLANPSDLKKPGIKSLLKTGLTAWKKRSGG